jgi:DeoR/GlpR family transcriptional regulator of sugar metabolism
MITHSKKGASLSRRAGITANMLDEEKHRLIKEWLKGFITTKKAAEKMNVSSDRIRHLIKKEKRLPAVLIGGIYFIDPADLKLVKERRKPGRKPKIIKLVEPK